MARKVKQFRFLSRKPEENPEDGDVKNITYQYSDEQEKYIDGSIFNGYYPIYQLGIQTLPGVRFKINKSNDYAYVSHSGVFELDLKGQVEIDRLCFYRQSMREIDQNPAAYLIVDIVYEED